MHFPDISERILTVLKKTDKLPIYVVAKEAEISVATASKYCYVLEAQGKIKMECFGNMKLVSKK
jgi:hypothetical protein